MKITTKMTLCGKHHASDRKNCRRLFGRALGAVLAAVCMLFLCMVSFPVSAADTLEDGAFQYMVNDAGDAVLTGYTGTQTAVTVPDTLGGHVLRAVGDRVFWGRHELKHVTLPDTVTTMGDRVFYDCISLQSVQLSRALQTLGDWTFYNCAALTDITLPQGLTQIGTRTFSNCLSLSRIQLPPTILAIGDFAFYFCRSLSEISLPQMLSTVGAYAFADCTSLRKMVFPKSVQQIAPYTCYACSALEQVAFGDVVSIGAFAFSGTGLTNITLPDTLTMIGDNAFYQSALTEIALPPHVTSVGQEAFAACAALCEVQIPSTVRGLCSDMFAQTPFAADPSHQTDGCLYASAHLITALDSASPLYTLSVLPGTVTIAAGAFSRQTLLTALTLPNSLCAVGTNAFADCVQLKNVSFYGTAARWETVEIAAGNPPLEQMPHLLLYSPYRDVFVSDWYYEGVCVTTDCGLFEGIAPEWFAPDLEMTRGMFVTVLYRMANSPHVDEETIPFEDVLPTDYYYSAVNWGVSQGILFGVSSTSFAPQEPIRRQDAMILLDRYTRLVGNVPIDRETDVTTSDFVDGDTVDTYALASVQWALQHGILRGDGDMLFPLQSVTRAQTAVLLWRYTAFIK